MVTVLNLITDIYSNPDPVSGVSKCIKRNVRFKQTFDTNQIRIAHYINKKGEVSKRYSTVYEGDSGFKVEHSFEYMQKLVCPIKIRGFYNADTKSF